MDSWTKKFGLIDTKIDFEFHLDENDVKDAERVFEEVRIIEINNTNIQFGFEPEKSKDGRHLVKINMGFASLLVDRFVFEEALKHFHLSDVGIDFLKQSGSSGIVKR